MDIGFHNCVARALLVHVSAEENIRRSLQVWNLKKRKEKKKKIQIWRHLAANEVKAPNLNFWRRNGRLWWCWWDWRWFLMWLRWASTEWTNVWAIWTRGPTSSAFWRPITRRLWFPRNSTLPLTRRKSTRSLSISLIFNSYSSLGLALLRQQRDWAG